MSHFWGHIPLWYILHPVKCTYDGDTVYHGYIYNYGDVPFMLNGRFCLIFTPDTTMSIVESLYHDNVIEDYVIHDNGGISITYNLSYDVPSELVLPLFINDEYFYMLGAGSWNWEILPEGGVRMLMDVMS